MDKPKPCKDCGKLPKITVSFRGGTESEEGIILNISYTAICRSCKYIVSIPVTGKILIGNDGSIKVLQDGYAECVKHWNQKKAYDTS